MTRPDLRTYRYQKLRAAFLAEITHCHWCHRPAPRLTIDHVLPIALHPGLDPLDVGNWVAACLPCNAKRGAMISNARRQRRQRPAIGYERPSRDW